MFFHYGVHRGNGSTKQEGFSIAFKNILIYFIPFDVFSAEEASQRASLLAYKPAVAFPSKLSATGFLPKDIALGESKSTAKAVTSETVVAAADTTEQHLTSQSVTEAIEDLTKEAEAAEAISSSNVDETKTDDPVADTAAAKDALEEEKITEAHPADKVSTGSEGSKASDVQVEVQRAQEDTSSSSSSDSESDSDSDDEKPETETVVKSEEKAAEEVLTSKQVHVVESVIATSASSEESQKDGQAKRKSEGVVTTSAEPVGSDETLIDPAPVIFSSTAEAIHKVTGKSIDVVAPDEMVDTAAEVKTAPTENIVENESEPKDKSASEEEQQPANVKTSLTEAATEGSPQEVAKTIVESSPVGAPLDVPVDTPVDAPVDVVPQAVQEVVAKPESEAASETMAKDIDATGTEKASSEDLKDAAPVAGDDVAAQSPAETGVEAPEGTPHIIFIQFLFVDASYHKHTFFFHYLSNTLYLMATVSSSKQMLFFSGGFATFFGSFVISHKFTLLCMKASLAFNSPLNTCTLHYDFK